MNKFTANRNRNYTLLGTTVGKINHGKNRRSYYCPKSPPGDKGTDQLKQLITN